MEPGPSRCMSFFSAATADRGRGMLSGKEAMRKLHFPPLLATKLCEEAVLKGHIGCVNRLAWNCDGSKIASGSDDRTVMIWTYPDTEATPLALNTQHDANIFGVHFLPCTNDCAVVSGSMDRSVNLHRLDAAHTERNRASGRSRPAPSRLPGSQTARPPVTEVDPRTTVYTCHKGRVKDVEVEPMNPYNFWSVSEDSTIRQFDTRCSGQDEYDSNNVLIGVKDTRSQEELELKGLDINKVRPDYMAVACGDPYVRVYDRRMLSLGRPGTVSPCPLLTLAPPHLGIQPLPRSHTTYVNFSNQGDKIVASYHGDHAYAFDVTSEGTTCCSYVKPGVFPVPSKQHKFPEGSPSRNGFHNGVVYDRQPSPHHSAIPSLSGRAKQQEGNARHYEQEGKYTKAIDACSCALHDAPGVAELYELRARLYIARALVGDPAFALCDADQAIALNPKFPDAHLRRLQALEGLGQLQTAKSLLPGVLDQFPTLKHSVELIRFKEKLSKAMREESKRKETANQRARQQHSKQGSSERNARSFLAAAEPMETDDEPVSTAAPGEHGSGLDSPRSDDEGEGTDGDQGDKDSSDRTSGDEEEDQPYEECLRHYCDDSLQGASGEASISGQGQAPAGVWWSFSGGRRLLARYIGHCNVQTDIKEAVFLGQNDDLVACGSDDGKVFIFNASTGRPVQVLDADDDVANCVQCHPIIPVLATSGIETVVRLWSPLREAGAPPNIEETVNRNQERMKEGPQFSLNEHTLQLLLDNYELVQLFTGRREPRGGGGDEDEDEDEDGGVSNCRVV